MPPKKVGKRDRTEDAAAVAAALKAEEGAAMQRELQIEAKRLKNQCEAEEKLYNQFLQEREKINYFWIVEKKSLSERQADLRNKDREVQDQDERHQIELKMFQQRLKHLRYHEQDEISSLKIESEKALQLEEGCHAYDFQDAGKDSRSLKVELKEVEISQEDFIRMLKLEQDTKIFELRQEFDRKARDLQQKYALKMKTLRDDMERQRKLQIQRIEEAKNAHISRCMKKNSKDFQDIKVYYGDITSSNLDLIKRLKEEHAEIKKRETSDAKQMFDLQQKNKQLSEPLRKAHADVDRLQEELRLYQIDKRKLHEVKEKIKDQEQILQRLEFQHEIHLQQCDVVQGERDDYYKKFQSAIYEVQQKGGLKNLLLEKKLDTVEEALEVTDAQVSELLMSANVEGGGSAGVSQKLDEIIQYKNDVITELHEEVQRIKEAHTLMVNTYTSKLTVYGIPSEELGFKHVMLE
eukprot:GEMP01025633.1.p1 GENE.GEMP01025633.1~~GEMP01025633.1.p1  ORF type:complete len:478 (+),score=113.13 GEMP01025633.1:44-1435(+)